MKSEYMKDYVKTLFKNKDRVNHMPTRQVMAIFFSNFYADGTPKPKKNPTTITNHNKSRVNDGIQLTIWDLPEAESWGIYNGQTKHTTYF